MIWFWLYVAVVVLSVAAFCRAFGSRTWDEQEANRKMRAKQGAA